MLNIEVNRSAEGVERYFDRELAVSDYLMKEPGVWGGRGAERLGLRGVVERTQFVTLLRNEDPRTGKRLTARKNTSREEDCKEVSNRQVGYGLVFGVPKSLSIYLAITGDEVVQNIARSSVDETMRAMECEMQCKVRKGGLQEDRTTGEMLYLKFFHRDSRPINGLSDPHWHVHCFVHNATFDPVEKRWKAGQFRRLIADKGYFQEYFHTLLAQKLMKSGYTLRRTERGWLEDLKADRLQAGWEKLECHGVIKEVTDIEVLREKAVEQHLKAVGSGKTSLMISPRHEEARKVAAIVRRQLKAEGAIGTEDHTVKVLRRLDLGPESCRDLLHYAPGRVIGFHTRTAGGFRPGEKWTVRETNYETVTMERNGKSREFRPSAEGKWDVLVSSTMQVSVGDQIRVTGGFREGKNRVQE